MTYKERWIADHKPMYPEEAFGLMRSNHCPAYFHYEILHPCDYEDIDCVSCWNREVGQWRGKGKSRQKSQ